MDLDDFESQLASPHGTFKKGPKKGSSKHALRFIEQEWWVRASRSARWMDLIGDYAGTEPFVLEGAYDAYC
jgi:ATP-dependent RNA helicase DDX60